MADFLFSFLDLLVGPIQLWLLYQVPSQFILFYSQVQNKEQEFTASLNNVHT
jgi:hypothetical protein